MKKLILTLLFTVSLTASACGDFLHGSYQLTPCMEKIVDAVSVDDNEDETDVDEEDTGTEQEN